MRQFMRPDEAMGAIVCWDGIITDMRILQRKAWQRVASDEGLPFPRTPAEQHVFELRPERAITEVSNITALHLHVCTVVHAIAACMMLCNPCPTRSAAACQHKLAAPK